MLPRFVGSEASGCHPKVLLVGGEDVNARLDLMNGLSDEFTLAAAGTASHLATSFARRNYPFYYFRLGRRIAPISDLMALGALWRIMRTFRPQIVHAFDTKPGVYACLAARLAKVPVVIGTVTGLGSLYEEGRFRSVPVRRIYEILQRLSAQGADLTIFQNREDREQFVARRIVLTRKSALIPGSGVPTGFFDAARITESERRAMRASLGIPQNAPLVTMVSRVIRSKGIEDYLASAQIVRKRLPDAHFLLIGPADKDSVDSFSPRELDNITRIVNWSGAHGNIPHILAASDLFVLPSYLREGIPRVLLEAAAMGLPIVTTDSPGCNDVVQNGVNGFLVPPRAPEALSEAVIRLLEQPELRRRFGQKSRQRALERFDLSVVVRRTSALYRELLTRKSPRSFGTRLHPLSLIP